MITRHLHLHLLFILLASHSVASTNPSLTIPISSPSTIPAFPEQSNVASSTCPLDLSPDLIRGVSSACSSPSTTTCCPILSAWLYSAYSSAALATHARLPAAAAARFHLPALPDDSESCAGSAEEALRARGVPLPRLNATCGVAYCRCGVRLRPLRCPGPFVASAGGERWVPREDVARGIEGGCARAGLAGCARCLKALSQLRTQDDHDDDGISTGPNKKEQEVRVGGNRECQLMGLTWLLAKDRSLYLPTAAYVLRAFLASPEAADRTSCSVPGDHAGDMPLPIDSLQFVDGGTSSRVRSSIFFFFFILLVTASML